ncbi:MAG TPA: PadR family transcriptional regulator [Coriobacteriia bacterium]
MTLEHAILGFLDRGSMTGYDLKTRCFDEAVGHLWTADQAQVYRTLGRLSDQGLVRSRIVAQRGKPDRRVFTITTRGRAELTAWLHRPVDLSPVRDPLLVQLSLAARLDDPEILALLERARVGYQSRLDTLRAAQADRPSLGHAPDARSEALYDMTLVAAMSAARTAIDWVDDCMEKVGRGLPPAAPRATSEGVA